MLVEKKFFEWNDEEYVDSIRLGDAIAELVLKGSIILKSESDKIEYRCSLDSDIWIGEDDGKVNYIFYANCKGDKIIDVDYANAKYPATNFVCESLSKRFKAIPEVSSIEELRKIRKGDFLYVIFRDFIPTNLFIIRID
ncbi:MAG: hypothetical protein ACK46Y_10825 [Fluviicola sp.]